MTDKEFLSWIYDRMIYKHGENKNVDYMLKFRSIIDSLQEEPVSEDLEKASYCFACKCHPLKTEWSTSSPNPEVIEAFKAGADWKKQQMMKV